MTSTTLLLLYNDFCHLPFLHLYRQTYHETNQIFLLTCHTFLSQHVRRAFPLSHHVILADVLRHMFTASLSRNPAASSDCRNAILQFFPPCQNKFTNKHGRYIMKLSLCTIDGQKTKFVSFCLFFTILRSGGFCRRRGNCDNLKIKLS